MEKKEFLPLHISVLIVSDTRTDKTDTSGKILVELLTKAGHSLVEKSIVPDDVYKIRSIISRWIVDPKVEIVITSGGTGLTGRDSTPEAVSVLFDKEIEGFGELFRSISYEEIASSTIQSRVTAGVANGTYIFCLPGSSNACRTAWDRILATQLDIRNIPCNFAELLPRLTEK